MNLLNIGKDSNIEILLKVSDEGLFHMCQTNKYFEMICNDESFWKKRYELFFPNEKVNIDAVQESGGWKKYYYQSRKEIPLLLDTSLFDQLQKLYPRTKEDLQKVYPSISVSTYIAKDEADYYKIRVITMKSNYLYFSLVRIYDAKYYSTLWGDYLQVNKYSYVVEIYNEHFQSYLKTLGTRLSLSSLVRFLYKKLAAPFAFIFTLYGANEKRMTLLDFIVIPIIDGKFQPLKNVEIIDGAKIDVGFEYIHSPHKPSPSHPMKLQ